MEQITITLTREEAVAIKDALILQAVNYANDSKTIGVDCRHPDIYHRLWDETSRLWLKVYNAIYPETDKED